MATKVKLVADNVITTDQIDLTSIDTDNLSEGSTNLYFTNARVDSRLSGGTGVTYSSGEIAIGQAVATDSNVTFADLTVTGDLNITGDINSYNVTDLDVTDQTITLGAGQIEANSGGSGIIVAGSNASILWDETNTEFDINNSIHVAGGITFGTSDSTLADNNVRFKSTGAAYIDHNTVGQDINFRISNASALDTTIMTLDAGVGSVGINQTSPSSTYKLDVGGAIRSNAAAPGLTLRETDASNQEWIVGSYGGTFAIRDVTGGTYPVYVEQATPSSTLYLDSSGNVGIGYSTPANKLQIGNTGHSGYALATISDTYGAVIQVGEAATPTTSAALWVRNKNNGGTVTEIFRANADGNVLLGTTNASAPGLTINELLNLSFGTGNNNESYVNFFRQTSSAAAVMATGYRRSTTANKMESSISTSWAKSAITANYGQIILYTDPASADAVGTTLTPTERLRVYDNGIIGINKPSGPADGGFGTPAIVAKQWVNSDWGGLNIEANGNDSVFSFSNSDTSHIIAGSYRTTAGYKDIVIKAGGGEKMRVRQAGGISIQNSGTYEIDFEGANSTNIRSQRAIYFLYDNGNNGDAYFGIGHNSDNAVNMLGRYKTSSGTNGSATGFIATSFGNSNGQTSIGQLGLEPEAPFHILKGGLTMNGYETPGVYRYLHSNSDTGQWMHMNAAGRSGSGVANFELYIPTAQVGSSWGSFGGDLFLSGYNGQHEYIIWRGYTNSGLAGASGTVVSGTGSPTITVGQNGTFGFYVKVSNISMTHPIAMYRVCKGGNPGREWDLSEISCRWY